MERFLPTNLVLGIHIPVKSPEIVDLQRQLNVQTFLDLHLTVLLMPIPEDTKSDIEHMLPEFLKTLPLPSQISSKDQITIQNGSVLLAFEDEELRNIHWQLLEKLNPIRGNYLRGKDIERMKDDAYFIEKERKTVEKYGFAYSGDLYQPHVSLGISENLIEVAGIERMLPVNILVHGVEAMIHHQDVVRSEIYWRCKLD